MLQDLHRQCMALRGEIVEHRSIGGPGAVLVALAARQLLFVEQDLAQLLGRSDVEFAAGNLVNLGLEFGQALLEVRAEPLELQRIDLDAGCLHAEQHGDQGAFDRLVQGRDALGHQTWFQPRPELHGDVGILGGIVAGLVERHLVERHLPGAAACHVGELDGLLAEMQLGQFIHAVIVLSGIEREGDQHRIVDSGRSRCHVGGTPPCRT